MCKLDVQALWKAGEGQDIQKVSLGGNIDFIKWLDMSDGLWQEHVGLCFWNALHFQLNWPSGVLFGLSINHPCMSCCVAISGFLVKLVFASVSVWKACGHKWLAAHRSAVCLFHTATSCLKIFQNANPSLLYSPCPLLQCVPSDSLSGVHIPWRHGQCPQTKQPHTGCKESQDAQTQPNF